MSRKLLIHKFDMLSGVSNNMSAAFTSKETNVEQIDKLSIHVKWSAAGPTGAFTVQARQDAGTSDWFDLAFAVPIEVLATDAEIQLVISETPFREIRVKWVPTNTVSATAKAVLTAKTVGA